MAGPWEASFDETCSMFLASLICHQLYGYVFDPRLETWGEQDCFSTMTNGYKAFWASYKSAPEYIDYSALFHILASVLFVVFLFSLPILLMGSMCSADADDLPDIEPFVFRSRGTPRPKLQCTTCYGLKKKVLSWECLAFCDPVCWYCPWTWFAQTQPLPPWYTWYGTRKKSPKSQPRAPPRPPSHCHKRSRYYYQQQRDKRERREQCRQDNLQARMGGRAPPQEILSDNKHWLLHFEAALFGLNSDFMETIDPIAEFWARKDVIRSSFLHVPSRNFKYTKSMKRSAFITAAAFDQMEDFAAVILPPSVQKGGEEELLHESYMVRMSIYLNQNSDDVHIPIVIDTGASMSLMPNQSDFVTPIKTTNIGPLQGHSNTTEIAGVGVVEWVVRDLWGVTKKIRTRAYYVPKATIHLCSPQVWFCESTRGSLLLNHQETKLNFPDGSTWTFHYNKRNNLPLMLPDCNFNLAGLSFEDASASMSVQDERNQNLDNAQKELLQ